MAFFVAFYSFKGGVGRTLALANVGYALASRGKRVVLLDLDLEAPGLGAFPEFELKGTAAKGLLEYAAAYRKTGRCPSIKSYVQPCKVSPGAGQLWVMPAGLPGPEYPQRLADLPWRWLHEEKGTAPFLAGLRQDLAEHFQPDYVLIDSRTGFSDIGGISTHQLADLVVLVFNLTRECLAGSVQAYSSFVAEGSKAPFLQLVASPIPPSTPGDSVVERRLEQARELMPLGVAYGRKIVRVDYNPAMVLSDEIAVRDPDRYPQAARYEELREALQRANPDEVFPVLEQVRALRSTGRVEEAVGLLAGFVRDRPRHAEGALELGNLLLELGRTEEAADAFEQACERAPAFRQAHRRLGETRVLQQRGAEAVAELETARKLGDHRPELFEALARAHALEGSTVEWSGALGQAMVKFANAEGIEVGEERVGGLRKSFIDFFERAPPFAGFSAQRLWDSLMGSLSLGRQEKGKIVQSLLNKALTPFQISSLERILQEEQRRWNEVFGEAALAAQHLIAQRFIEPTNTEALLGLLPSGQADWFLIAFAAEQGKFPPQRTVKLLEEVREREPDNPRLLTWLGRELQRLARGAEGEERRQLLRQAAQRYEQVIAIESDKHEALNDWGNTLAALARETEGEEGRQLLRQAAQRYEQALAIKPDLHEALHNWGIAFDALARRAEGEERFQLFRQAAQRYEQALAIKPDKHDALHNWGITLNALALQAEGDERRQLLRQAAQKYEQATAIKPDKHEFLYSWGIALDGLAGQVEGEERRQLLRQAAQRYEQVIAIKPDKHEAFYNWGCALEALAREAEGEERYQLFHQAAQLYEQALAIKPGLHEALNNWGNALAALAREAEGEERRQLFHQAARLYEQALAIKPGLHEALNNWASALLSLGTVEPEQAPEHWREAARLARRADELRPGAGAYNLACALSRLEEWDEAAELLFAAIEFKPSRKQAALEDPDFEGLWKMRPDLRSKLLGESA